jgi:hypothetical protein
MTRQVAIGAVVGFALTVVFLSRCHVSLPAPAPADGGAVSAPAAVPLKDMPLRPLRRITEGHPRLGSALRRSVLQKIPVDGGS